MATWDFVCDSPCPHTKLLLVLQKGGYDYKLGTSERGTVTVDDKKFKLPPFKHMLIVFGGVDGIEDIVENDSDMSMSGSEANRLFNAWVNTCPSQGSRTIRTEEAVLISLARLAPLLDKANSSM